MKLKTTNMVRESGLEFFNIDALHIITHKSTNMGNRKSALSYSKMY